MAVNKNALIRYKVLDKCFRNKHRNFDIKKLIEACNEVLTDHYVKETTVSRRQIYLDINFMKSDAGFEAPIEIKKSGKYAYYYYEDPNFTIENKPLTHEEYLALENTLEVLSRIKGIPGLETIGTIETKLSSVKDNNRNNEIISFEENEFLTGLKFLSPIYNYIKNKQPITIFYQSFKSNNEQIINISPQYLKQYNNRWFLFGCNHKSKFLQNLALDRIVKIEMLNEAYIETEINFDEYFDDIVGVSNHYNKELTKVKIKLTDNIIPYIKTKPIHGSQKIVNNVLHLDVKLNYELESIILSYGENMQVISPKELVDSLKNRIKKLNDLY